MKSNWQTKKLIEVIVGIIFIIFAIVLCIKAQYGFAVLLAFGLIILLRLDSLTEVAVDLRSGFKAKFRISKEKIEENIRENKESITPMNLSRYKNIEQKILTDIQQKLGGEMKTAINYVYGPPNKPAFIYSPDGSLQTKDTLYFFEIKYVLKPEFANEMVNNASKYLNLIYSKFSPIAGKNLVLKLVLASKYDLSHMSFDVPKGIEIEFYKI